MIDEVIFLLWRSGCLNFLMYHVYMPPLFPTFISETVEALPLTFVLPLKRDFALAHNSVSVFAGI